MSAIAAIWRPAGPPAEPAAIEAMIESMAQRSPDGTKALPVGPAALANGALNTTTESAAESLPLERDGVAVTADARLDNRPDLLRELGLTSAGRTVGDGELILAAYERWGERCPERFRGDFAFVVFDARRGRAFCARDHFGVKPLYWHHSPDLFVAASELKALLALPEVPRRLNEERLVDFLTVQTEDRRSTAYRDLLRLEPGHALTVDRQGARRRCFWALDPERSLELASDADYEEAFRAAFLEAVGCRLRSSGPLSAMLSGGLDSSSIVCAARELLARDGSKRPLHTLSAVFDDAPASDERPWIEAVLALGGLEPHFARPQRLSPLADWPGAAWRGEEPESNPQVTIAWAIYTAATEAGARVALDGFGGDFVVSFGLELLTELALRGRWLRLFREARAFSRRFELLDTRAVLRAYVLGPFVPAPARRLRRTLRERRDGLPDWSGGVPIRPDYARSAALAQRYAMLNALRGTPPRDPRRAQWQLVTQGNVPLALNVTDRIAGTFALEPRYPFLDPRLAELCLAIPADQKLRDGYNRSLARRALADLMPEAVRLRGSKGLPGAAYAPVLEREERGCMDELLLGDPGPIARYVDIARLRKLYRECLAGADATRWYPVFRTVVGALWLDQARERYGLVV